MKDTDLIEEAIPHLDGQLSVSEIACVETCREVYRELRCAMAMHKPIHSQHEAWGVITEELEEFWEHVKVNPAKLDQSQRAERMHGLRKELIQTAAMCVRTIVDLEL